MAAYLHDFWQEEDGQYLIEYSLLITFIAIACAAIVGAGRPAVNTVWTGANNQIANAATVAGGS